MEVFYVRYNARFRQGKDGSEQDILNVTGQGEAKNKFISWFYTLSSCSSLKLLFCLIFPIVSSKWHIAF